MDIKQFRPSFLQGKVLNHDGGKPRQCRKCPAILASWVKYYCSFRCIELAKVDGSYGHELDDPPA
jgi:hypothetical protein